ncbi:MAG TPA: tetratricopeptide repeat protein, partial [Anaerolineae bacterium]
MSDLSTLTLNDALSEVGASVAAHQFEPAIQRCNELLAAYPSAVRVIRARAQALEKSGRPSSASEDYRRVLEILPTDDGAMLGLARCLSTADKSGEAATLARQALDYVPQNAEALQIAGIEPAGRPPEGDIARSRALLRGGIAGRAITLMRRMNEAEPDRTDVQVLLAEMLWRNGVRITTAELCQAILDEQPDCLNAHVILSAIWAQAGNHDLEALHQRALQPLDPDYRQTFEWLGDASPLQPHDVPALLNASPQPPAAPQAQPPADGDPDRSAWVEDLIASSGPVTPLPPQERPTSVAPANPVSESEVYAGEVTDTAPLEWAPVETDHTGSADEAASELPQWLRNLQASAAHDPAIETAQPPAEAAPADKAVLELPPAVGEIVALKTDWLPLTSETSPEALPAAPAEAIPTVADPPVAVDQTPVEVNPAPLETAPAGEPVEPHAAPAEAIPTVADAPVAVDQTPVEVSPAPLETAPAGEPVESPTAPAETAPAAVDTPAPAAVDQTPVEVSPAPL